MRESFHNTTFRWFPRGSKGYHMGSLPKEIALDPSNAVLALEQPNQFPRGAEA
jgi:hypothetical protein